jgi:hypothetical protein
MGVHGTSPTNRVGRPLAASTLTIRDAILDLQYEHERMTVRGIFYALTVRGVVEKAETGYRKVQRQALLLRREGLLPWGFIADGTRWVSEPETWDSTEDALLETARSYRRNLWRSQGVRIEVWLEKDALASLLRPTTHQWGVRLMVSRGQSSDTYLYNAAQDAKAAWATAGVVTFVYMLYDSDRYGRDAADKVEAKLAHYSGVPIECELLAVTDWQIDAWDLPTRPAKRAGDPDAVELDAIPPDALIDLVDRAIRRHVDEEVWEKEQAVETSEREILMRFVEAA